MLTSSIMQPQQHGAFRHVRPNTLASYRNLVFPWQYLIGIQALIGNVTCICLCKCTNMYINHQIVMLSILIQHTLPYQYNISTIILRVKTSQCSEPLLRRETYLLQRQASTTRASQSELTHCSENHTRCSECSLSQLNKA